SGSITDELAGLEINGQGGANSDDVIYLGKSKDLYKITLEKANGQGRDVFGTITDTETGKTISFKNIEAVIYNDGTSEYGHPTVTHEGYSVIDVDLAASLADGDGSESLSPVTLSGIPSGVELFDAQGHRI